MKNSKILGIFAVALLVLGSTGAASAWTVVGGSASEFFWAEVGADRFGNVYLQNDGGHSWDISKYDDQGNHHWTKSLTINGIDINATGMTVDPYGSVYVTSPNYIMKLDNQGNMVWNKRLGGIIDIAINTIVRDDNGNIYLSGYTNIDYAGTYMGGDTDAFIAKYDPSGNLIWRDQYGTDGKDIIKSIAVDHNGNAYTVGYAREYTGAPDNNRHTLFSKYDANGNQQWSLTDDSLFVAKDVAVDSTGHVYTSSGTSIGRVTKYDSDGIEIWHDDIDNIYNSNWIDPANGITVDSSDIIHVAGRKQWNGASYLKYDTEGNRLSEIIFGGRDYEAMDIAVDIAGNAYLAGKTSLIYASSFLTQISPSTPGELAIMGDFNEDGSVGLLDLNLLGMNWGKTGMHYTDGDANGDGTVGLLDLNTLGAQWGQTATPEPTSLAMLALGSLLAMRRR